MASIQHLAHIFDSPTSVHLPVLADVGDTVVEAQTQQLGRVGNLSWYRYRGNDTRIRDTQQNLTMFLVKSDLPQGQSSQNLAPVEMKPVSAVPSNMNTRSPRCLNTRRSVSGSLHLYVHIYIYIYICIYIYIYISMYM